jgi:hypothetical protein
MIRGGYRDELFWHGRCEIIFEKQKGGESDEDRDIVLSSIAARG